MGILTAPMLFAQDKHNRGNRNCFYCAASCDETHTTKDNVGENFTNLDIVKCPDSLYVCVGCNMVFGNGTCDIHMLDGGFKAFEKPSPTVAPRMYSWFLTVEKRLAFTKAHIGLIREIIIAPPDPPFSIIISDSGQKNLIFRAPIANNRDYFPVMLEEAIIEVAPQLLKERLTLCGSISAKIGKPVLSEKGKYQMGHCISAKKVGVFNELMEWEKIKEEPLSKLAAWLAPPKEK